MDNTEQFTCVEFCAGYGGIGLGLKRAIPTLRVIAACEIEAFAAANLVAKMEAGQLDPAPVWTDIKTFPRDVFRGRVGILVAGYPCQPFSHAGKRGGHHDPRHLWPYIRRAIRVIRPAYVFLENVEGHITLGLSTVLSDLASADYRSAWGIFSAAECGAPHQRKRVFILGVDNAARLHGRRGKSELWRRGRVCQTGEAGGYVADAEHSARRPERRNRSGEWTEASPPQKPMPRTDGVGLADACGSGLARRTCLCGDDEPQQPPAQRIGNLWPARPGEPQHAWEPPRVTTTEVRIGNRHGFREWFTNMGNATGGRRGISGDAPQSGHGGHTDGADADVADSDTRLRGEIARSDKRGLSETDGQCWCECGQIESPLGRDADGTPDRLDDAELHTSCDSRVDELRLLGNGVVPAVAERALRVLLAELNPPDTQKETT